MPETEHLHPPQEPDALSTKWVAGVGVGTIALTVVLALIGSRAVGCYGERYAGPDYPQRIEDPRPDRPSSFPLELYVINPHGLGAGEQSKQAGRKRLDSWGWVDRAAGTVHLPIDVAMDLVAADQETP